jgi:colanic acid/amylovoran biosynthesis glycosyltransferase
VCGPGQPGPHEASSTPTNSAGNPGDPVLRFERSMNVAESASRDVTVHAHPRLAYLLSIYPATSHTFFLNEIAELRRLGFTIDVASINKPAQVGSGLEGSELATTYYLKATAPARIFLVLLKVLLTQPRVVLRGLRAALQLDGWNLPASCYALFYLVEALLLGDWLRRRGHTHLHIHFGGPVATVGMLASMAWQISYSMMIHGPEEFYDVDKFYLRRKVERAQFVLCISDYCRSQVMKVCDAEHWAKLHVVRLGVDHRIFAPPPGRPPGMDRSGAMEIICVGRMVPAKGHLILLRAFAKLLRCGYRLQLRLIGDGTERSGLEAFARSEKIDASVIFEGSLNHEATRQKLTQADMFVLASFAEGLPVALMEAMAMEIPCVSTFVAGIPELIRDGVDGLLVPPSSEEDLFYAMVRMISDADLRHHLAAAGHRRVLELYDLQQNVRLLADTLRAELAHEGSFTNPD